MTLLPFSNLYSVSTLQKLIALQINIFQIFLNLILCCQMHTNKDPCFNTPILIIPAPAASLADGNNLYLHYF